MAVTLPSGFAAELEAETCRPLMLYELELAAGTLYYSSQGITWNSQAYTALAVRSSPLVEEMSPVRVPEVRVRFDNVNNTLRSQIEPTDLITGQRMTLRLIMKDSGGIPLAGSLILFRGLMQRPRRIDQNSIEITVFGLLHGVPTPIPQRRFGRQCDWEFADGTNCLYTSTTTATNSGSSSTALIVASGVNLEDGESIKIGSGAAVDISSGGGTVNITLAEARTWSISDAVVLQNCTHEYPNCQKRVQTHLYGGFRGVEDQRSFAHLYGEAVGDHITRAGRHSGLTDFVNQHILPKSETEGIENSPGYLWFLQAGGRDLPDEQPLAERAAVVPVLLGRRLIPGKLVELFYVNHTEEALKIHGLSIFALSDGGTNGIESVIDYYTEDGRGDEKLKTYAGGKSRKVIGFWYRVGGIGLEANETEADYENDATKLRDQNRDFFSGTTDPLSRTAYASFIEETNEVDPALRTLIVPTFDAKGLKVQKYTAAASPTTDGAPVYVRNPLWQALECCVNKWFGLGRVLSVGTTAADTDFDWTVIKPEADVCDVTIDGRALTVASTSDDADSGVFTVWDIGETEDFARGMAVEHDDGAVQTSGEVLNVWSETEVHIDIDDATAASPDTLTPKLPRYTCDLYFNQSGEFSRKLSQILACCDGYITYADGKIQFRVERTGSSVATFADSGAAAGYGIIADSFEWVGDAGPDSNVNRVVAKYVTPNNEDRDAVANDWEHRKLNPLRSTTLDLPGVDNRHQAQRLAERMLARSRTLDTGARFIVGPAGLKVQPGDIITVTHAVPNWSAVEKRVVRVERMGLGSNEEFLVRLHVIDYDSTIYPDTIPDAVTSARNDTAPAITLTVDNLYPAIALEWSFSGNITKIMKYSVYKAEATMGADPASVGERIATAITKNKLIYHPDKAESGVTLYFVVVGKHGKYSHKSRIVSNEVTAVPGLKDPTEDEDEQGINLVAGSEMDNPGEWNFSEPAVTSYDANTEDSSGLVPPATAGYSNPTDAYDDDGDSASAAVTVLGQFYHHEWGFSAGGSEIGWLRIRHEVDKTAVGKADNILASRRSWQRVRYSNDGGSTYKRLSSSTATAKDEKTEIFTATRTDLKVRARTKKGHVTGNVTGQIYNITWDNITGAAPWSIVSNSTGSLLSDGGTHATISRGFPGVGGDIDFVIPNGQEYTVIIWAKADSPDASLLVDLYTFNDDTYTNLLTVTAGELEAGWHAFANLFTAGSKLEGPMEIFIRTLSTGLIVFDKPQVYLGDTLKADSLNPEEVRYNQDFENGRRGAFPRGPWDASTNKKADIV